MRGRTEFGLRLLQARKQAGLSQEEAGAKVGIGQGSLSELERSGLGSSHVVELARVYCVDPDWLATGGGNAPTWISAQHPVAGEEDAAYQVAQRMSHPKLSDALPLVQWEDIVAKTTPAVFRALLTDDALSPQYNSGDEIVWSKVRRASPGRVVLVRDQHGQLHAREFRQGKAPGQWYAAALNPAYVSFDSLIDRLQLVAVYKGRLEPDD